MSIAQDRDKSLWIATYRNGVFRYDGKELKHYPITDGLRTVKLFTVYCDRTGTIWLGTHEDGAEHRLSDSVQVAVKLNPSVVARVLEKSARNRPSSVRAPDTIHLPSMQLDLQLNLDWF